MLRLEGDLAQRDQCISSPIEKRLCALEYGLTTAAGSIDRKFDHGVPEEELIKCAVEEEVNRKTEEEKELEARKNNVIMFRIPEKKTEDVKRRRDSDVTFVKDLLDCVFDMKILDGDVTRMYRLGQWDENKPRPLLVSFRDADMKEDYV